MNYFKRFVSNTYAATTNQHFIDMDEGEIRMSRAFYKITYGGEFNYSLLFSSIIDGSFRGIGIPNTICDTWQIHGARVGRCKGLPAGADITTFDVENDVKITWLGRFRFDGDKEYIPDGGELFCTDSLTLSFEKDDYLCLELTFSGAAIPYHPETQIPLYVLDGGVWKYSCESPLPCMIGCDREVSGRICFMGDSITQGCGAGLNSYKHWAATLSDMIGDQYSYWDIGIGYGKVSDAASDGALMYKAIQNDTVFVCYGVNDINSDKDADTIVEELSLTIDLLKEENCRVVLQTVPPFDYPERRRLVWEEVNGRIKTELCEKVDLVFDCVPILAKNADEPHMAKYGGHPNAEGCTLWAEALYKNVKELF